MNFFHFLSPLEQFYILPLLNIVIFPDLLDLDLNTFFLIFTIFFVFSISYIYGVVKSKLFDTYLIPNRWQFIFENLYLAIFATIQDNIQSDKKKTFLPLISFIFFFILSLNLFGILPFTFTITSELIITFAFSLAIFLGIQIIAVLTHKLQFFSLFFPSGVSVYLALLLVPIEIISFICKPISLSIRLFANMMAGHTLLKVIAGFVWVFIGISSVHVLIISILFSIILLAILFALETGVALIQAFVFAVLLSIYVNDILNLH